MGATTETLWRKFNPEPTAAEIMMAVEAENEAYLRVLLLRTTTPVRREVITRALAGVTIRRVRGERNAKRRARYVERKVTNGKR